MRCAMIKALWPHRHDNEAVRKNIKRAIFIERLQREKGLPC